MIGPIHLLKYESALLILISRRVAYVCHSPPITSPSRLVAFLGGFWKIESDECIGQLMVLTLKLLFNIGF